MARLSPASTLSSATSTRRHRRTADRCSGVVWSSVLTGRKRNKSTGESKSGNRKSVAGHFLHAWIPDSLRDLTHVHADILRAHQGDDAGGLHRFTQLVVQSAQQYPNMAPLETLHDLRQGGEPGGIHEWNPPEADHHGAHVELRAFQRAFQLFGRAEEEWSLDAIHQH